MAILVMALPQMEPATYYVAPWASEGGNGSFAQPWADMHAAAERLTPGDTLVLRGGVYFMDRPLELTQSGTEDAWITVKGAEGERVILDGSRDIPQERQDQFDRGIITIKGPSYVRVEGIEVHNSYRAGIWIDRPSSHIDIIGCKSKRTFKPGIGAWNVSHLRVIGNEVTEATTNRMRLFGDPSREAPHEAISIAGVTDFEVAFNHVHHVEKEGIDVKEVSRRGRVHHNYIHDVRRQGLYVDAWFGLLEDVEFHHNLVHNAEWGIAISVEGRLSELRNVVIRDNIFFKNRASGIYFGTWGGDGPRSNILIAHNTIIEAGNVEHWAGPTGGIDVRSPQSRGVTIVNNVIASTAAFPIGLFFDPADASAMARYDFLVSHNWVGPYADRTAEGIEGYGRLFASVGQSALRGEAWPARNPNGLDFRLREDAELGSVSLYSGERLPASLRGRTLPGAELTGIPFRLQHPNVYSVHGDPR